MRLENFSVNIPYNTIVAVPDSIYFDSVSNLNEIPLAVVNYDVAQYMDGYIEQYLEYITLDSLSYISNEYEILLEAQNVMYNGLWSFSDPDMLQPFFDMIKLTKSDIYNRYQEINMVINDNGLSGPDILLPAEMAYRGTM